MLTLISYDGSADARAAIQAAARLCPGASAQVLTVWDPIVKMITRTSLGLAMPSFDFEEVDQANQAAARQRAQEGAQLATDAGLTAEGHIARCNGTTASTILDFADQIDAAVIVLGTRGLGSFRSLLLGSVSHAVLQHANRPVVVIPSEDLKRRRVRQRFDYHDASEEDQIDATNPVV